ncbi:MAG: pyruvate kinase [Candidatus Bipolaricaulota bacterium]|nr:pyruvate kinase [Candidatus Bipolaricaulota bacterium]
MASQTGENRTKIVCTIGPATRAPETLRTLVRTGMNVARVNYSHGTAEERQQTIRLVRQIAAEERAVVAVLADLQGPKLRLGDLARSFDLAVGDRITLTSDAAADGSRGCFPLPHPELIEGVRPGGRLVFGDGEPEAIVREVRPHALVAEITVSGRLSSRRGIAAPGSGCSVEALTSKDRDDAKSAVASGADYVALSFVRTGNDVRQLREHLATLADGAGVGIVAKIEKPEAIENLDDILEVSDAVMVARGDLGVEMSPQDVPMHQKAIIRRCNRLGKPVITATQMLQSMTDSPRPTRAEASDVANAILDGTDAVMLSAETATGRFPVQAAAMMREIAAIAERQMPWHIDDAATRKAEHAHAVTDAISDAAVRVADEVGARLIVTSTWSGYTARQIARERPHQTIVALTPNAKVERQLALVWGVVPVLVPQYEGTDEMLRVATQSLLGGGYAVSGELVVLCAGVPIGGGGTTNFIKVERLGAA